MTLQFNNHPVTNPQTGMPDTRYKIDIEAWGQDDFFVLRYHEEFVVKSKFYAPILSRAIGLAAEHRGEVAIVEIRA